MNKPLVSAIVPAYNAGRFLEEALQSALAQTFQMFEIVIVDDGSSDDSGAIADRYASRYPHRFQVLHQVNQGLCYARNAAIAAARGRYLALLDADDVWLPHHLAATIAILESSPRIGLVHSNIEFVGTNGRSRGQTPQNRWSSPSADPFTEIFVRREHVSCPTAVFRRETIDEVGAFDVAFNRKGCEDRDLWLRIANVADVHYIDEVHANYRVHDGNMSGNLAKMHQARLQLVEKFGRDPAHARLRRCALTATLSEYGEGLFKTGQRGAALMAYASAFAQQPTDWHALRSAMRCLLASSPSSFSARR